MPTKGNRFRPKRPITGDKEEVLYEDTLEYFLNKKKKKCTNKKCYCKGRCVKDFFEGEEHNK